MSLERKTAPKKKISEYHAPITEKRRHNSWGLGKESREGGTKSEEQGINDGSHWRQVQGWLFVDNPIKWPNPAPGVGNFKDFMTDKELTCQEENHCLDCLNYGPQQVGSAAGALLQL